MNDAFADFDARMDAVMANAATFDADAIAQAQSDLGHWVANLRPDSLDERQLRRVRDRLRGYRDLCSFLQSTLNQALATAGRIEGAGYTGRGPSMQRAQPLMRRYG
jgi:hypothetical protein